MRIIQRKKNRNTANNIGLSYNKFAACA